MKKSKILSIVLVLTLMAAVLFALTGCLPWNENARKYGIEVRHIQVQGNTGIMISWNVRGTQFSAIDYFEINIFALDLDSNNTIIYEATVSKDSVLWMRDSWYERAFYSILDIEIPIGSYVVSIRSISRDRFSIWSSGTFYNQGSG